MSDTTATGLFGYQDYATASAEAEKLSWDAYNSGNTEAADYWSSVSWNNWSASTDLQIAGVDAFGANSLSTGESYFPGAATEPTQATPSTDFGSYYDAISYDSSISSYEPYADTASGYSASSYSTPDYSSTSTGGCLSDSAMSYYTSSD